jgi:hypothetical protein
LPHVYHAPHSRSHPSHPCLTLAATSPQVSDLKKVNDTKYSCSLSDSSDSISSILASQIGSLVKDGSVKEQTLVSITSFACNTINGQPRCAQQWTYGMLAAQDVQLRG